VLSRAAASPVAYRFIASKPLAPENSERLDTRLHQEMAKFLDREVPVWVIL
jgi:hypothetical protein